MNFFNKFNKLDKNKIDYRKVLIVCGIFVLCITLISVHKNKSRAIFKFSGTGVTENKAVIGYGLLVDGQTFSKTIKDFVNGTTDSTYKSVDNKVTYLGFYERKIPEGYTIDEFFALDNVSVSENDSVKAYHDNGKVYVYSKVDIVANESMYSMFRGFTKMTELNIINLDTSNTTNMESLFNGLSSIKQLDLSSLNTFKVTNMLSMFNGCSSLSSLDLKKFNTNKVTSMYFMFYGCSSLEILDLSSFDTSNVITMSHMFEGMESLKSLNLSNFNTSKVRIMSYMFHKCRSLTTLNLSSFDTSLVSNVEYMFSECTQLTTLDLSVFNSGSMSNTKCMFIYCNNLQTIYVGQNWTNDSFDTSTNMFSGCSSLVGGNGTTYDGNLVDKTYAVIDTENTPGYLTYKENN